MTVAAHRVIKPTDVITKTYRALQVELHCRPNGYGGKGDKWAEAVRGLITRFSATSVLDYGCGEGSLKTALDTHKPAWLSVREYDPAIQGKDGWPDFADLVVCTDVLEHVEPELLGNVLTHLKVLARKAVFVVIATRPSGKVMLDGRNAHLIQEQDDWWAQRVTEAGFVIAPNAPVSPSRKPSREWVAVLVH